MIYPAPSVPVGEKPPHSFAYPGWDLEIDGWLYEPQKPVADSLRCRENITSPVWRLFGDPVY
jgi:hypothetical protein